MWPSALPRWTNISTSWGSSDAKKENINSFAGFTDAGSGADSGGLRGARKTGNRVIAFLQREENRIAAGGANRESRRTGGEYFCFRRLRAGCCTLAGKRPPCRANGFERISGVCGKAPGSNGCVYARVGKKRSFAAGEVKIKEL